MITFIKRTSALIPLEGISGGSAPIPIFNLLESVVAKGCNSVPV